MWSFELHKSLLVPSENLLAGLEPMRASSFTIAFACEIKFTGCNNHTLKIDVLTSDTVGGRNKSPRMFVGDNSGSLSGVGRNLIQLFISGGVPHMVLEVLEGKSDKDIENT